jgi:hypothetical protein
MSSAGGGEEGLGGGKSYDPVEFKGILLSGINAGGAMALGGGGNRGGGGTAIMGGFDLSTTLSIVPVDATRGRLEKSSALEIADSIDCLLSDVETLRTFESGPGAAGCIGTDPFTCADDDDPVGVRGATNWNCWLAIDPTRYKPGDSWDGEGGVAGGAGTKTGGRRGFHSSV